MVHHHAPRRRSSQGVHLRARVGAPPGCPEERVALGGAHQGRTDLSLIGWPGLALDGLCRARVSVSGPPARLTLPWWPRAGLRGCPVGASVVNLLDVGAAVGRGWNG